MKYLVVSSCTSRKSVQVRTDVRALCVSSLRAGRYESVARQWKKLLDASESTYYAGLLYQGRTVTDATTAAEALNGQLAFVSAGMGVVLDGPLQRKLNEEKIPTYSLTVSPGNADSVERVIGENFSSSKWWLALTSALDKKDRLKTLIEARTCTLALLAMPTSYVEMVSTELRLLSSKDLEKLRIFGPRSVSDVPEFLKSAVMPYDERLNSKKIGMAGTESDFAQRALLHFVREIFSNYRSATQMEHADAVRSFLSSYTFKRKTSGRRVTDDEICRLVRSLVPIVGLKKVAMLRRLRDVEGVACEQKRFTKLMSTILECKK